MTYRDSEKRLKIRSAQGVAMKAALRMQNGDIDPFLASTSLHSYDIINHPVR